MTEELKRKFKEQGVDETFVRTTLLPAPGVGLKNYASFFTYEIEPLTRRSSVGGSEIFVLTVYNGTVEQRGKRLAGYVIKDHKPQQLCLWNQSEIRKPHDRYLVECQLLNRLRDVPVIYADDARDRVFLEQWEGSLDSLLEATRIQLRSTLDYVEEQTPPAQYFRQLGKDYIQIALRALVSACGKMTEAEEDIRQTGVVIEEKSAHSRKAKLEKQLRAIVEKSLEVVPADQKLTILNSLEDRLQHRSLQETESDQSISNELTTLARYLVAGRQIIHHDPRTSNLLYLCTEGFHTQKLPAESKIRITLCDFEDVRKGPISHDISAFLHDPYVLFFYPDRGDRYDLYKKAMLDASPMLRRTEERYARYQRKGSFEHFIREDFKRGTILALIEKMANSLELEKLDPESYKAQTGGRELERTEVILSRNLDILSDHLSSSCGKAFGGLRYIIRQIKNAREGASQNFSATSS